VTRAVFAFGVLLAVWKLGVWHGRTEEAQSRPLLCPKVEARWIGTGTRRRLDTLTYLPEVCR
jgi:hypothetical protein